MKRFLLGLVFIYVLFTSTIFSQNVAINTTGAVANTSALLDVDAAPGNNKGILIPRVALTATNSNAPIGGAVATSLMVYNTATASAGATAVTPGYYYWDGAQWVRLLGTNGAWQIGGNYFGGTGASYIFGTMTNDHIDWWTNGTVKGRISNQGEFIIGATATALAGDLMNGVANATFPWAVNGYTNQNGGAVYGLRLAGASNTWGSIQGETDVTNPANSPGVHGTVANASHIGVRGIHPAGAGWGGLFLNDLGYSGGFFNVSDRSIKRNIVKFNGALDLLNQIPIYSYNYKTEDYDILGEQGELHFGVMADELKQVFPNLVKSKSLGGIMCRTCPHEIRDIEQPIEMVNYVELIPVSIEAIKELNTEVNDLKKENQELKDRLNRLEAQMLQLQK